MGWVKALERPPKPGSEVKCRLKHWNSENIQEHDLVAVEESDCSWRTPDGCELSYDWSVIEWWEE